MSNNNNGNGHKNGYHCHRRLNGRDGSKIMPKGIDIIYIVCI
jgi:hypothetical protein